MLHLAKASAIALLLSKVVAAAPCANEDEACPVQSNSLIQARGSMKASKKASVDDETRKKSQSPKQLQIGPHEKNDHYFMYEDYTMSGSSDINLTYNAVGPADTYDGTWQCCFNQCLAMGSCLAFTTQGGSAASTNAWLPRDRSCHLHTEAKPLFHKPGVWLGIPAARRVDRSKYDFFLKSAQGCLTQGGSTLMFSPCSADMEGQKWSKTIDGVFVNIKSKECISNVEGKIQPSPTGNFPLLSCAKSYWNPNAFSGELFLEQHTFYNVPDAEVQSEWDGHSMRSFWQPGSIKKGVAGFMLQGAKLTFDEVDTP